MFEMRRSWIVLSFAALLVVAASAPKALAQCGCCACDFGAGDIECGNADTDCAVCIDLGGTPATSCSVCGEFTACSGQTLCTEASQCTVQRQTPAMSASGLFVCAMILAGVGALGIARRRLKRPAT